jgi:hypothetical protein
MVCGLFALCIAPRPNADTQIASSTKSSAAANSSENILVATNANVLNECQHLIGCRTRDVTVAKRATLRGHNELEQFSLCWVSMPVETGANEDDSIPIELLCRSS